MNNYSENDIHKFKAETSSYINNSSSLKENGNFFSKEISNSREMILKVFSNIDKKKFEEKDNIENTWKKIVTSIKSSTSNEDIGSKLFYHSSIIDLKNEILLIETDHPGFIQLFRIYEKYILNGFKKFSSQLKINTLSFRLKGSSAVLADKEKETEEKAVHVIKQKFEEQEKILEGFYGSEKKSKKNINFSESENSININENKQITENLSNAFERMKKSMLTKTSK